ncbi:MAG: thiamine pyrophosphate-binding protein [Alphaproteobacteria bacterium]|jgi:acetolactate synthase I/II/III large subunit|nr:thiamine pyrophosphate-binding protein [Alphaproteobacteria bacterium]MBT4544271.1 thiamine pyrophosphate-binding protein [Alphaproteobacteria bacterium]MBT7743828.1 thiamine pyrophosphate-binding protein [Alphaproteobacteria bacterium]
MSDTYTVGDLVAEFLQACGVETAFGVISVHNIPMLDGIGRRNAIRFVTARGEAGAGHMADAWARARNELGVLITSTGPGAANAVGALVEARFAGTPLLHLTGQTATGNIGRDQGTVHEVADQLGMLASVSKTAHRISSAETAFAILSQAAAQALTPPMGPVSVEIPIDIQRTPVTRPAELDQFQLPIPTAVAPSATQLDLIADILASSKRPLLWCGSGARYAGEAVARLADMGVPVVTSWNGRGVLPEDHAMSLRGMNGTGTPLIEDWFKTVDLMLVAGSRLRGHETMDMTIGLPERRVQIDVDPLANGRTYDCEQFICGDASLVLHELADRLEGRLKPEDGYAAEIADLKARTIAAYKDMLGAYATFPDDLREAMPRDTLFARDLTMSHSTWGHRLFPLYDPRSNIYPVGAAIGPGLAMGIGAAIAAAPGQKVLAMCGDGGFNMGIAELPTAAQEKTDVVFLVMNDAGYGVIRHIQDTMYGGRQYYGDVQSPDFKALAGASGLPYWRVSKASDLGNAMKEALAVAGPTLVEVDMTAIGPYPRYFAPPPHAGETDKT